MAALFWKIGHKKILTDDKLKKMGVHQASVCRLCKKQEETWLHLFNACEETQKIWEWIYQLFNTSFCCSDLLCRLFVMKNRSAAIKQYWEVAIISAATRIWKCRNDITFEDHQHSATGIKACISYDIKSAELLVSGTMHNSVADLQILKNLGVSCKPTKVIREGFAIWIPPNEHEVKYNTDGAAAGNPGPAGAGIIARNHNGEVIRCKWYGLGVKDNYYAELEGVLMALEDANEHGLTKIWIECDNLAVVKCCQEKRFPWWCYARFMNLLSLTMHARFSHIWREGNQAADCLAKRGSKLGDGIGGTQDGRPAFLYFIEAPYVPYLRCK